jgi:hypothetical protein
MILLIISGFIFSFYCWLKDSLLRECETRILDKKTFEDNFDKPLDYLEDIGVVDFIYRPTRYYKYFKLGVVLTVVFVCLKVVSLV